MFIIIIHVIRIHQEVIFINKNKFYSLSSDTTFKYLFKNPKTRFFFNELIYYYTSLDISEFNLIDNELSTGNKYVNYRIDTLLINKNEDIIINVELNREHEEYTELRNRRYLHTLAGTSKDSNYHDKRVVIQLNLQMIKIFQERLSNYMIKKIILLLRILLFIIFSFQKKLNYATIMISERN